MTAIEGRLTVSESIAIASDVERASNENIVVDDDDLTARTIELDEDGNEIEPDINRTVISIRDEYRAAHGIIVPMGTTAVPADDGPNSSGSTSSNGKRKGNSFCGLRCRCDMRRTVLALNLINLGAVEINPLMSFFIDLNPYVFFSIKCFLAIVAIILLIMSRNSRSKLLGIKLSMLFPGAALIFLLVIFYQLHLILS